jgi:hypothetical protein
MGAATVQRLKSTSHLASIAVLKNQKREIKQNQLVGAQFAPGERTDPRGPHHTKLNPMMSGVAITKVVTTTG